MANYIPAEMPALVLHYLENKQNKSLFWGTKTSVIQYPFMLVSTYFGLKVPNFRDELKKYDLMDNFLIFGDSGGFQNYSMNANLNPIDVLRWQEKNCDIAATFDYPIGPDDNNNKIKEKQIKTVDNAYMALNNKQTNIKIYAAVQGHSIDEQKFIYDYYNEKGDISKFDGFAIGGWYKYMSDYNAITYILINHLHNLKKYNKPVHFFGLSSEKHSIIFNYLEKKFNIHLTFDSSTFSIGGSKRIFCLNDYKLIINEKTNLKNIPCNCQICKNINLHVDINLNTIGRFLSMHNLSKDLDRNFIIRELVNDEELFKDYVKSEYNFIFPLEMIDYYFINGIEKFNKKYNHLLNIQENKKQITVFG